MEEYLAQASFAGDFPLQHSTPERNHSFSDALPGFPRQSTRPFLPAQHPNSSPEVHDRSMETILHLSTNDSPISIHRKQVQESFVKSTIAPAATPLTTRGSPALVPTITGPLQPILKNAEPWRRVPSFEDGLLIALLDNSQL